MSRGLRLNLYTINKRIQTQGLLIGVKTSAFYPFKEDMIVGNFNITQSYGKNKSVNENRSRDLFAIMINDCLKHTACNLRGAGRYVSGKSLDLILHREFQRSRNTFCVQCCTAGRIHCYKPLLGFFYFCPSLQNPHVK